MLLRLIRYVRGFVEFQTVGKSPERFLNLCAQRGVRLWNAQPEQDGLRARMLLRDYRDIRKTARRAGVRTRIRQRRGFPFVAARYRGRIGLPIGAAAGLVLLLVLSNFIWTTEISGAQTVSEQRLRTLLAASGVAPGAWRGGVDAAKARRDVLLQAEEIGWMSVNIVGCHVKVEIKEKVKKPAIDDAATPCNIKASADGVITKVIAEKGTAVAKKGSGAAQGDLLVSGVVTDKNGTVSTVRAKAEVWADVLAEKDFNIPEELDYYSLTENKSTRRRLRLLRLDFPCSLSFRSFDNAAYTAAEQHMILNNTALPLGFCTETAHEIRRERQSVSRDLAQKQLSRAALLYELFEKGDAVPVQKTLSIDETDSGYACRAAYVFNENIAQTVDFSAEE